jgi:hypothetical protein
VSLQLSYMEIDPLCRVESFHENLLAFASPQRQVRTDPFNPADILDNMYIPAHFAADEQAVDDLLTHHGAADLITATPGRGRYYAAVRL